MAVAVVLVREEDNSQKPVYQALSALECRYLNIEKLAYFLLVAARKLRAYFSAHPITLFTEAPLKKVLHKPESLGRMLAWSIELTEFQITYSPRRTIKAQASADFVAETSLKLADSKLGKRMRVESQETQESPEPEIAPTKERTQEVWTLFVDGSASKLMSGAGILLIAPCGEIFKRALRFKFEASNNQAEYEAIIAGMKLARDMGVPNLEINRDSQLIVNQIKGEYDTNNPVLAKYCSLAKSILKSFEYYELNQIMREGNAEADLLSRIIEHESTIKLDNEGI